MGRKSTSGFIKNWLRSFTQRIGSAFYSAARKNPEERKKAEADKPKPRERKIKPSWQVTFPWGATGRVGSWTKSEVRAFIKQYWSRGPVPKGTIIVKVNYNDPRPWG